jgi:hypothetical protein
MRPVIEKQGFKAIYIVYIALAILCIIAIGIAVYMQFFKDEKIGVVLGITKKEDKEYNVLKENFTNIFTNNLTKENMYTGEIKKIRENEDIVFSAYNVQEQKDNYTINIQLPFFNINSDTAKEINKELTKSFKEKSEQIMKSNTEEKKIYTIKYKAYVNNEILSMVILSELKEGNNNQRIIFKSYNYNLATNKQVDINELIQLKNIDKTNANKKIKEEIEKSQEQNTKLAELGYNTITRDATSDTYKIENTKEFFLGDKGYLYIIYPYGNKEYTSEMDIVIIK